ncbi:MAG: bis-aminopropyl spermidine synthase family protein [Anaerolineae bacterium]|nr:bis-aminopropyl spermidine synthase family protein [Anaerolineae bacterium]
MNEHLLDRIAEATSLREGTAGVAQVLRIVYQEGKVTLRELSHRSGLPVPVLAAVRGELEKVHLLSRRGGLVLTEQGRRFVEQDLKITTRHDPACPTCHGRRLVIADDVQPAVEKLERVFQHSPAVDVTLDQAPCLAETSLRRALCMYQHGALEGKDVIILGDDDLVSLAIGFLGQALGSPLPRRLTVIETDARWIDLIQDVSQAENLAIECIQHDLRDPLPEHLRHRFDTFETDPPYTTAGMTLFVSRAIQALRRGDECQGFLSFGHKSPPELLDVHLNLVEMGLVVQEMISLFNAYQGASILGGFSQMMHLLTTSAARPLVPNARYEGAIYTGESSPTTRLYACTRCKKRYEVGQRRSFATIESLKATGCTKCGNTRFRYLRRVEQGESS